VHYQPSALIGVDTWQNMATGFEIGTRFHSAPVIRLADARPMHLGHTVKADARWHIYAFSGAADAAAPNSAICDLCDYLENDSQSALRVHTPDGEDIDALIDVRAVFQQGFRDLAFDSMPQLLRPAKGRYGLVDSEKVFCPGLKGSGDIFDMRGIDRDQGCILVVRPDQYVAHVLPLDAYSELAAFFGGFMLPAG